MDLEKSTKGYSGGHGGNSGREKSNCIIIAKAIFKSKKKKQFLDDWERSDRSRKRGKTR